RLVGGIDDVHQPLVRTDLELVSRGLVDVRRAQHVVALDARRQRHRAADDRAGTLGRVDDLGRRLVDQPVVERLEADADFLVLHDVSQRTVRRCRGQKNVFPYSTTLATTPAPTVRPPSRIAKRRPCSIAIGAISVTTIFTLSPGITISVPSGNCTEPVTSVVRK